MRRFNLLFIFLLFASFASTGQTAYNPFTNAIHYSPEPSVAGFSCDTTTEVVFNAGLTTKDSALNYQTAPLQIIICLTGFELDGPVSTAVYGSYASNFTWQIDPFAPNCIMGTQSQALPGAGDNPLFPDPNSIGEIRLKLHVPETSPINQVLGVNVNLQVPGYMSQYNSLPDDNESSFTQTYCALKIKGTVYYDTLQDGNVNGTPINSPNGSQLYVNLVDNNGLVVQSLPVNPDGSFVFENVNPNVTYTVMLSTIPGVVGNTPPASILPGTWQSNGEDCCDGVLNDGSPDGLISVPVTDATMTTVSFGIFDPIATPIRLKQFSVVEYNCNALLTWTTSSEENTSHVDIYRMTESSNLVKLSTVKAQGYSTEDKLYSYVDNTIEDRSKKYQYFINFVDIDGQQSKSEVRSITIACEAGTGEYADLYPNPAQNDVTFIYSTESDDVQIRAELLDMTGRVLESQEMIAYQGTNVLNFQVSRLAKGQYIIRYENVDSRTSSSLKFTKE